MYNLSLTNVGALLIRLLCRCAGNLAAALEKGVSHWVSRLGKDHLAYSMDCFDSMPVTSVLSVVLISRSEGIKMISKNDEAVSDKAHMIGYTIEIRPPRREPSAAKTNTMV